MLKETRDQYPQTLAEATISTAIRARAREGAREGACNDNLAALDSSQPLEDCRRL